LEHDKLKHAWRRPSEARHAGRRGVMGRSGLAIALVAAAMLLAGLVAANPALAQTIVNISDGQRVGKLTVSVGKSETLRVSEPFENVVVGNAEIADVAPLTDQSLYLLGRAIGTTNMALYDANSELIAVIDVEVTYDVSGMREALAAALPGAPIQIRTVGGRVMLQGALLDAMMVDRAMQIAADFAGENVTNALTVASPQQVMLEVRIIEASRSLGRELGIRWDVRADGFQFSTLPNVGAFGQVIANFGLGGADVDMTIRALEEKGIARSLAEPNLTALSGQTASFHAGGEFPVPVLETVSGADEIDVEPVRSVEFKPFGVRLSFTPTVLADGVINLLIEPEVSDIDPANEVFGVPGVTIRAARTTVELRDGQSMAMAGLLQTRHSRNADQIPWLADVPVLGALFRSTEFQKNETELVVIVTPRLVLPVPPGIALATPLDNTVPSNDPELVLFGQLEVTPEQLHLIETGGNVRGPFGHMLDLPEAPRHVITK
jgi:pilus assembly protein CpaC